MASFESLNVDVSVVLGKTSMALSQFLKLGRGAVVDLDAGDRDLVTILANGHPVARGEVVVNGTAIQIEITELVRKATIIRTSDVTIGKACELDLPSGLAALAI